jgi:hypothetical protein
MKIEHVEPESEMNPGHKILFNVDHSELTLGKDLSMIVELFGGVGLLGRIHALADVDNGPVVRGFHKTYAIVRWEHGLQPIVRWRNEGGNLTASHAALQRILTVVAHLGLDWCGYSYLFSHRLTESGR